LNCLTQRQLIAYMEDRLSSVNKKNLESHLDHCMHCQQRLEQWIEEGLDQAGETLAGDFLSDDLDQKIIRSLTPHPVTVLNLARQVPQIPTWKRRSIAIMKKTTIAAAALAVALTGGMLVSPTFATFVQGAFTSKPVSKADPAAPMSTGYLQKAGDEGIEQAAKNGFVQKVNLSTTDQGYTFEVQEVVADPLRISIMTSFTDQNGKPTDVYWDNMRKKTDENEHEYEEIVIKDKQGNVLKPVHASGSKKGGMSWQTNGDEQILFQHELSSYFTDVSKIPDELVVEFHIKKLGDTAGSWKLSVPVDMKKAKVATKTYEINKTYTTPQGLTLDLKQITFAPTGVEMVIDRTMKESGNMNYSYQLVDDQGTVLGDWDYADFQTKVNVLNTMKWRKSLPIEGGMRDFQYFHSIDEKKDLTFKLGSVYAEVPAEFNVKLDLARLEKEPVTAQEQGDRFTFKKFVRDQNEVDDFEDDGAAYIVNPDGTKTKIENAYDIAFDVTLGEETAAIYPFDAYWSVTDESGKKYDVNYYIKQSEYKDGKTTINGHMKVLDMKAPPKQLTISYDEKMVNYSNVDWKVPILSGE
jgi:anti-sigma factor RsiW